ncbi:hypothetical protein QU38_02185, partial [Staphylococcus aureus]
GWKGFLPDDALCRRKQDDLRDRLPEIGFIRFPGSAPLLAQAAHERDEVLLSAAADDMRQAAPAVKRTRQVGLREFLAGRRAVAKCPHARRRRAFNVHRRLILAARPLVEPARALARRPDRLRQSLDRDVIGLVGGEVGLLDDVLRVGEARDFRDHLLHAI